MNTNNQTHDFLFTMLSPVCTCTTKYDSREGKNVKFEHKVHCTMYTQCTCYKYLANGSLFCTVLTPFFIYNSTCTSIHTFIDSSLPSNWHFGFYFGVVTFLLQDVQCSRSLIIIVHNLHFTSDYWLEQPCLSMSTTFIAGLCISLD